MSILQLVFFHLGCAITLVGVLLLTKQPKTTDAPGHSQSGKADDNEKSVVKSNGQASSPPTPDTLKKKENRLPIFSNHIPVELFGGAQHAGVSKKRLLLGSK